MTRLIFFLLLLPTTSCNSQNQKTKSKIEIIKNYDYYITIDVWNGFYRYNSKFILNNLHIDNYDSRNEFPLTKPLTLYHVSAQDDKIDTTEISFSKSQSDTLFNLTNSFFKKFIFNNYDTAINNVVTKPYITDDSHATVELQYGGRTLNATISSISNPTISTKEFDRLLHFVEKFIAPDKR